MTKNITWAVRVDWTRPRLNEPELEQLLEQLAPLHPAIGVEEVGEFYSPRYTTRVAVDAPTVRQAIATALRAVEDATGVKATGLEAITWHEAERRLNEPTIPDLVGHAEVAEMLGVSRQRAAQLADRDDFPPAVVTTKAGPLRVRSHVEAWAKARERKTGRPRKQE